MEGRKNGNLDKFMEFYGLRCIESLRTLDVFFYLLLSLLLVMLVSDLRFWRWMKLYFSNITLFLDVPPSYSKSKIKLIMDAVVWPWLFLVYQVKLIYSYI